MKAVILGLLATILGATATAAGVQIKEVTVGQVNEPVFRMVVERVHKPSIEGIEVKKVARARGISLCEFVEVKNGRKTETQCKTSVNLYLVEDNKSNFAKALCNVIVPSEFNGESAQLVTTEPNFNNLVTQGTGLSFKDEQFEFTRLSVKDSGLLVLGVDCGIK